jgi:acetoin utilization deacetylase AcuC-like enzyme
MGTARKISYGMTRMHCCKLVDSINSRIQVLTSSICSISTHQVPLYPGTGLAHERGAHDNIVNLPLSPGSGSEEFRELLHEVVIPRFRRFRPDLILISAGFDSHESDPLGGLALVESDFAHATRELMRVAEEYAQGRIVSVLEGGYNLDGLKRNVLAHVAALAGGTVPPIKVASI